MAAQPTIMELAEKGRAEDLHTTLRQKAYDSLYFFAKFVMGYKDLTPSLHKPFCDELQSEHNQRSGYLYPRGHFKSTVLKAYAVWRLIHNSNARILYVGESDDVASKNLRDIKCRIEDNQILKWLFPEIVPADFNAIKWTESEILLPRTESFDESSIMTAGVGAKMTGFHFDLIIYDDVIGEKAAMSEAEMQRAITWVQYAPGLLHNPELSEEKFIGTRWKHGTGDLYGWLMEHVPEIRWHVRSAIEDDQPIFPERFTLDRLEKIRQREGDYKYHCQYSNNPTPPEGADFPPSWIQWYEVSEDGRNIIPCDGSPVIALRSLLRMSFYDVSAGGKSATAENAIVGGGMDTRRRVFVLAAWSRNCPIGEAVEKWHVVNDQFIFYKNHYEQVGAQKAVEDVIRERKSQTHCPRCSTAEKNVSHRRLEPVPIKPPGGSVNKEDRIRMFAQAAFQDKRVYLRKGMIELSRQITGFPHTTPIDQFDALAYLINLLRPPISDEEVKDEKEKFEAFKAASKPRTHTAVDYGGYS